MAALIALLAFVVALFAHLIGGHGGTYSTDAELVGFIFVALALLVPGWWGIRRP